MINPSLQTRAHTDRVGSPSSQGLSTSSILEMKVIATSMSAVVNYELTAEIRVSVLRIHRRLRKTFVAHVKLDLQVEQKSKS